MFVCQWSFDIPFGKQREAIEAVKAWGLEKMRSSTFRKSTNRLLVGHVGASASHVVDEYFFESIEDFEQALADMGQPQFQKHAEALAPYVVPGTQRWTIYRVVS